MTLFRLKQSQNESSLTQIGVKKHKKVSKSEIMNQNTLKKQWNESKFKILNQNMLKKKWNNLIFEIMVFFDFEHAKKLCNLNSSSYFP